MIVRTLDEITGTDRDVHAPNWNSKRLLLAEDGMGFSLHETVLHAGTTTRMWYKNHLEAVYCIEGEGTVTVDGGPTHRITPGTVYALDKHDRHVLEVHTRMRFVCVFNPPLTGRETHDADGAYPPAEEMLRPTGT